MRLYFDKELTFEKFNEIMIMYRPCRIFVSSGSEEKLLWFIHEYLPDTPKGEYSIVYGSSNMPPETSTLRIVLPLWIALGFEGAYIEVPLEVGTASAPDILKTYSEGTASITSKEDVVYNMHHQVLSYDTATGTTAFFDQSRKQNMFGSWNEPERVSVTEFLDRIEMVFIETSNISNFTTAPEKKVFKVIFSCVDGKWNKSERIYGTIQKAVGEQYIF